MSASPPLCLRAVYAGSLPLARASRFLAARLRFGRERGGVCVCHRAVSIMARESVCWQVASSGWAAGS